MHDSSLTDYSTLHDGLLVKLLRADDEGAFKEIYRRYWHRLLVVARQKLQSQENAEEIVQDIFVDIWTRRGQLVIEDLNKYLFSAVKYRILNCIKARLIQQKFESYTASVHGPEEPPVENELAYKDLHRAIEGALIQLPDKTQKIFRLNRLENQSVREIATLLCMPERTVEYHITQSLRVLRLHLRDFILSSLLFLLGR